jgi:CheY-like chemotaxis protein
MSSEIEDLTARIDPAKRVVVLSVWNKSMVLLDNTPRFQYYTLHGKLHHESVLRNLTILINGGLDLSEDELYLLLLAVAVHDIGMVMPMKNYSFPDITEGRAGLLDRSSIENFIRDVHHEVISEYIKDEFKFLSGCGVSLPDLAIIVEIARAHRKVKLIDQRKTVKRLGAIMRIIDELDIGPSRAPLGAFEQRIGEMDATSIWHWYKHIITEGWTYGNNVTSFTENGRKKIVFNAAVHPQKNESIGYWLAQVGRPIRKALDDEQCQIIIEQEFNLKIELDRSDELSSSLPLGEEWLEIENQALGQGRISILVVDDEIRRIEDLFLPLMEKCFVQCVPRIKTAFDYLAAKKVNIVILDMQMPSDGMWSAHESNDYRFTGLLAAKKIREEFPSSLVVALSGIKHTIPEGSNEVFDLILRKPIDPLDLRDEILTLLEEEEAGVSY